MKKNKETKINVGTIVLGGKTPKKATAQATDLQKKEAYYLLGLLSATFSELEIRIQHLLGSVCRFNGIIEYYLIEENSLDRNLQLLKKINDRLGFEVKKMEGVHNSIKKIKELRNKLIHGKWEIFIDESHSPVVAVWDYKIVIDKRKDAVTMQRGYQRLFSFSHMEHLISDVKEINTVVINLTKSCKQFYKEGKNGLTFMRLPE